MTRFFVRFVVTAEWSPDHLGYDGEEHYEPDPRERRHTGEVSIPIEAWNAEDAVSKLEKKLEDLCK